jgi:HSP20 family protein
MSLIPWRHKHEETGRGELTPWGSFRSEFDQLFENFFRNPLGLAETSFGEAQWGPTLDVSETDKEVTVHAELPGVKPEDLDISVAGDVLVLAGEKKESIDDKREGYYRAERRFGSFRRELRLPTEVDADKVTAEYKDGVLTVRLQKSELVRAKRIAVQVK